MENENKDLKVKDVVRDFKVYGDMGYLDIRQLAGVYAKSGFFENEKDLAKGIVKLMAGIELGLAPTESLTGVYPMQGKITLSVHLMTKLATSAGVRYHVKTLNNDLCEIDFFVGDLPAQTSAFTIKDAEVAGLLTGPNKHSWQKYRRNMLFARAFSNGFRWFCSTATGGRNLYTPEEMGARLDEKNEVVPPLDVTPIVDIEEQPDPLDLKTLEGANEEALTLEEV